MPDGFGQKVIPGRAEVRSVIGTATVSTNGSPERPLKVGQLLPPGSTIKTEVGSSVDLFLGTTAGRLRVGEKSILKIEELSFTETGADTAAQIEVNLPDGEMYFDVNKMSKGSRYQIKMPTGVAGIRGTKGVFSFRPGGGLKPPVVLLTGSVIFTHTPPGAPSGTYFMTAPPAVYFSPTEGVKPLPQAAATEVTGVLQEMEKVPRGNREGLNRAQRLRNPPSEPFLSSGYGGVQGRR